MTASDVVTIISACSVALVAIIGAWRVNDKVQTLTDSADRTAHTADKKLDAIHQLTNSNLTTVKTDLAMANERIIKLEGLIQDMAKGKPSEEKAEIIEEAVKKTPNKTSKKE
jgi:hypothetical protein